jgi:DNA polymerase I-like protein with 3'-5' exonuclease and polymerase domains
MPLVFKTLLDDKGKPTKKTVQFQNFPRSMKRLLKSRTEGWLMMEADGSQLEFRAAADLARDKQAIADINNKDWDAHITSAAAMAQVPYAELYEEYTAGNKAAAEKRQAAKVETFKPLYGGRSGTPTQERWYAAFRKRYPDICRMQDKWINQAVDDKRLITPWGLRYYFPTARREPRTGYANVTTAVSNYPIQAFATAEIIPIAIVSLWHRLRDVNGVRIVNTVHDSVVLEVHPEMVQNVIPIVKAAFTLDVYKYLSAVYGINMVVPLGVGFKAGKYLGTGKEEAFNIYPDGREVKVK